MIKIELSILIIFITFSIIPNIQAQENDPRSVKPLRNNLNLYFGFYVESNLNYERNFREGKSSYTNIRVGIGKANFRSFRAYAPYLNSSLVHLTGKNNSHFEINLGFKYPLGEAPETIEKVFIPDLFAGYRYEKPRGHFIFRAGINYPTVVNLGIGIKF